MSAVVIPMSEAQMPAPSGAALLGVSASDNASKTSDLFKKLEQQFKRDERSSREWRRLAKSWYALRDGDQWDADTLTKMRKAQKPAITFNRCNSVIATVCGIQISNRQDVFVYPRSEGDAEVSEIGTEAIRWFDDRCNADTEESRAFRDCLTCGIGATETRMDYLDHQDGKGYRERINPMSCFWDASASKRNLTDAMVITSGYRTPGHQATLPGGRRTGAHVDGMAVDVLVSGEDAHRLIKIAMGQGAAGIGVQQKGPHERRYVHLDCWSKAPEGGRPTVWSY